jgi:hypothetical protein
VCFPLDDRPLSLQFFELMLKSRDPRIHGLEFLAGELQAFPSEDGFLPGRGPVRGRKELQVIVCRRHDWTE